MDLKSVELFVRVIEHNGFTAASEKLEISKQTISRRISDLEKELGVRLLERNTRYLRMTDKGRRFFNYAIQMLELTNEVNQEITQNQEEPSGLLRIAAPILFGELYLNHVLHQYTTKYPKVSLEVEYGLNIKDPLQEGFDIIFCLGPLKDSTLIAKKILPTFRSLFASPEFLQKNDVIEDPKQLATTPCISYYYQRGSFACWDMKRDDDVISVTPDFRMQTNNFWLARNATLHGLGIASLPWVLSLPDVKQGRLVQVLPEWNHFLGDLYAVYPSRKYLSFTVRTFLDLVDELKFMTQKEFSQRSPETVDKLSQLDLRPPKFIDLDGL